MGYKILSTEVVNEDTTVTKIEYTFKDGSVKEIDVHHFRPQSEQDIITGVQNREISEQRTLDNVN